MRNYTIPEHRVEQVVNTLYERWSETAKPILGKRSPMIFGRYVQESEGMFGCYAAFCINGVVYIDSELYGQFNSDTDLLLVAQVMELQSTWANGDYREALNARLCA